MSKRNSREAKARRRAERARRPASPDLVTIQSMPELEALAAVDPDVVLPCGCTAAHELETSRVMAALASGMPLGSCDYGDCPAEATRVVYWRDPPDEDHEVSYFCAPHADLVVDAHPDSVQTMIGGS